MGDPVKKSQVGRTDYICPKKEALINEILNPTGNYKIVQEVKRKVKRIYMRRPRNPDAE